MLQGDVFLVKTVELVYRILVLLSLKAISLLESGGVEMEMLHI